MPLLRIVLTFCLLAQGIAGMASGANCCTGPEPFAGTTSLASREVAQILVATSPERNLESVARHDTCCIESTPEGAGCGPAPAAGTVSDAHLDNIANGPQISCDECPSGVKDDACTGGVEDRPSWAGSAGTEESCAAGCDFCAFCGCCLAGLTADFAPIDRFQIGTPGALLQTDLRPAAIPAHAWDILHVPKTSRLS